MLNGTVDLVYVGFNPKGFRCRTHTQEILNLNYRSPPVLVPGWCLSVPGWRLMIYTYFQPKLSHFASPPPWPNAGTDLRITPNNLPCLHVLLRTYPGQLDPVLRNTNRASNQVTTNAAHSNLSGKLLEFWALGMPPEIWMPGTQIVATSSDESHSFGIWVSNTYLSMMRNRKESWLRNKVTAIQWFNWLCSIRVPVFVYSPITVRYWALIGTFSSFALQGPTCWYDYRPTRAYTM